MGVLRVAASSASGSGNVDPGFPAGAGAGHLLILDISGTGYEGSHSAPSGDWTLLAEAVCSTAISAVHVRTSRWWAWYDPALVTEVPDTGNQTTAAIRAYSGADPTTPIDVATVTSVVDSGTSAVSCPSITTVTDNCMISVTNGRGDNNGISGDAWTNAALTSLTHAYNVSTTAGGDSSMAGADGILETAGASGATTATLLSSEHHANITVAIRPYVAPSESDSAGWDNVAFTIEIETDTDDVYADVTDDYVAADFHTASRQEWGQDFVPGSAVITLKNPTSDLEYSIGHTDDAIDASRKVRITMTHDETDTVVWNGFIHSVSITDAPHQVKLSTLVCRTALANVGRAVRPAVTPVGADDTTTERLDRILDSIEWDASLRDYDDSANYVLTADTELSGSAMAELQLVARSVNGEIYEDVATGDIVFLGTVERTAKWTDTPVIQLYNDWYTVLPDDEYGWDSDRSIGGSVDDVINFVDVATVDGERWAYINRASIAKHGSVRGYIRSDLLATSTDAAQNHAYFMAAKFTTVRQYVTSVELTDGTATFIDALVGLKVLDAVSVFQGGASHMGGRSQVQGIHYSIAPARPSTSSLGRSDKWRVVIDLDDTEVQAYVVPDQWKLGDATLSVLGETTTLYAQ